MRIIGKAPCEDPQRALATMDFPSKERFLFVGGPLDGMRCHVEMTTHGPDNIIEISVSPEIQINGADAFLKSVDPMDAKVARHAYIRHPMHEQGGRIHFIYQHRDDPRNIIVALVEGYRRGE